MDLKVDQEVVSAYPDLKVSIVEVRFGDKLDFSDQLMELKKHAELSIRSNPTTSQSIERIQKYDAFYKKFDSKVPMEFQLKSIAANKDVPANNPILTCMFLAELKNVVLTAGHDMTELGDTIRVSLSKGGEEYRRINEKPQRLKRTDVFASDGKGIISSVLYGPDSRTKITGDTRKCVFMCYAFGLTEEEVRQHMSDIRDYLGLLSKDSFETSEIKLV